MDNKSVAAVLREIGVLLELKGENPFKIRAYENAARLIDTMTEPVTQLAASGELTKMKGIGSALAGKLTTLVTTGSLPYHEELRNSLPQGLLDLLRIPGLGPKKIFRLYETLGIASIGELAYACHENRLIELKGFGKKSQESILQGIEYIKGFQGKFLYSEALADAEELLDTIQASQDIRAVEIAGSLRRGSEIVKDIDIVAACEDPAAAVGFFTGLPTIAKRISAGDTKASVILESGIPADFRAVRAAEMASALHHFTGSKEHNTAMRQRAKAQGMKLNEYGLFAGDARHSVSSEKDIFDALGLACIPPELRENTGEIEAAERNDLPVLVEASDISGVFHVHTPYSDGVDHLPDLVAEAKRAGFSYLGIADHSRSASYAGGLSEDAVRRQSEEIKAFNEGHHDFRVFHGIESDILKDGSLDYSDEVLALFDFVIGSVHSGLSMSPSQATNRILAAVKNPFLTMLGHPTGRLLLGRPGYELDIEAVLQAAREYRVVIELNANPHRLDLDWRNLKRARELCVPVSINPDAHRCDGLYDTFYGVTMARKGWLEKRDVFNTRSSGQVQDWLNDKKNAAGV